jgi:hypothetical protein
MALFFSASIEALRGKARALPRAGSPSNGKCIRADEFSFVLAWIQVIVRFLNSS